MIKLGTNNIGSLYFGSNPIGKAYLGSNLVFQSGGGPGPTPTNYIPYIRGGGDGSYIDTGITPDNTVRIVIWARNFNPECGLLCGTSGSNGTSYMFSAGSDSGNITGTIRTSYGTNIYHSSYQYQNLSHYHKYEFTGQGTFLIDDVLVIEETVATFTYSENIFLYGVNKAGTLTGLNTPVDICACKIYKNDVLVRDYTPSDTPNVGLYDSVSQTLFTNAGSGTLTYGEFNNNAYTALDYISCANNQWFDTGIYGTGDLFFAMRIMPTNTTARWTGIFGEYSPTYSTAFALSSGTAINDNERLSFRIGTDSADGTFWNGNANAKLTGVPLAIAKIGTRVYCVRQDSATPSIIADRTKTATSGFTTHNTMPMCGTRDGDTTFRDAFFEGRIYHLGIGGVKNYVPAKVSGKAGMYDTYNDVFVRSASGTDFVAGNEL